jgi:hypothetical protein
LTALPFPPSALFKLTAFICPIGIPAIHGR